MKIIKKILKRISKPVKTGIKKYDDLPSRVRSMDIDIRRYKYQKLSKQIKEIKEDLDWAVKNNK